MYIYIYKICRILFIFPKIIKFWSDRSVVYFSNRNLLNVSFFREKQTWKFNTFKSLCTQQRKNLFIVFVGYIFTCLCIIGALLFPWAQLEFKKCMKLWRIKKSVDETAWEDCFSKEIRKVISLKTDIKTFSILNLYFKMLWSIECCRVILVPVFCECISNCLY